MKQLTVEEMDALQSSASEIYAYKSMLAIAYKLISSNALDETTKNILKEIHNNEKIDSAEWLRRIEPFFEGMRMRAKILMEPRVRLMVTILGPRSYLEWALIAEDECVEGMAILAANVQDKETSDNLTRIISDERLHVIRMKEEILGMQSWEMGGGGGIRDVIFGANDGLVSILALVAGVYGAVTESSIILITGISGAIAGTISMGAGAYLSTKSEKEVTQKENERKGLISGSTEEKREALIEIYLKQGFKRREAESVADRVIEGIEFDSAQTIGEVTGLTTQDDWPPSKAGILTGISFLVASIIPILPFAIFDVVPAAIIAMIGSIITLFLIGASKAMFSRGSWLRSGLENMLIGMLAAAATYVVGKLIPGI